MGLFKSKKEEPKEMVAPDFPPTYDQLQQDNLNHTQQYSGPNEYAQEKGNLGYENTSNNTNGQPGQNGNVYTIPPNNLYQIAPQQVNIAYETDGKYTRPGYSEYLQNDQGRIARGDIPKPREAFGRGGAPLSKGSKNNQKTGGGAFPGSSNTTYHNAANK